MAIGGAIDERRALWVEYVASRTRKAWAMNHGDAVGWLSSVVRAERSRAAARPARVGDFAKSAAEVIYPSAEPQLRKVERWAVEAASQEDAGAGAAGLLAAVNDPQRRVAGGSR
jgi:hypothetical protein